MGVESESFWRRREEVGVCAREGEGDCSHWSLDKVFWLMIKAFFFSLEGFDSGGRGSSIGFGGDGDAMFLRGLECNHS